MNSSALQKLNASLNMSLGVEVKIVYIFIAFWLNLSSESDVRKSEKIYVNYLPVIF